MPVNLNGNNNDKRPYWKKAAERMFAGAEQTLFKRAAELRKQPTHAEELLWTYLRTKPLGFEFRRQHPYLNYILDFYCRALRLAIEVDGAVHNKEDVKKNDETRQKHLEEHGLTILRFTNDEIEHKPEEAVGKIEQYLTLKEGPKIEKTDQPKSPL